MVSFDLKHWRSGEIGLICYSVSSANCCNREDHGFQSGKSTG